MIEDKNEARNKIPEDNNIHKKIKKNGYKKINEWMKKISETEEEIKKRNTNAVFFT